MLMWKIECLNFSPYSPKNWASWKGTKWFGDLPVAIFVITKGMSSFR